MPAFHSQAMADLTRQLTYAPAERLRKQMDHAEQLYWQVDPERNYPLDFIVYRITRFRPDAIGDVMVTGAALRHDLLVMVESLSEAAGDRFDAYTPRPRELAALCRTLNVSGKTVARYRRQGLFARRMIGADGRRRLGFMAASVERFLASRAARVEQATRFTRMDDQTQHEIIMRARRIRSRVDTSAFAVAVHLSRRMGRSVETIRRLLLNHDRRDPRLAIFPEHTPTLTERDQRLIHRAYRRGVRISRLAERFNRSRNAIYRAINLRRAQALQALPIHYVASPTFDLADAEQVILGAPMSLDPGEARDESTSPARPGSASLPDYLRALQSQPRIDAKTETALFARYNFLKYRADRLRATIDRHHPRSQTLDQVETCLRHARQVKLQIFDAFIRVVASVAGRHVAGVRQRDRHSLEDLIDDGAVVLLEAIESFDPGRGNRFSTYLTWSLMRRFARQTARAAPLPAETWIQQASAPPPTSFHEHTESVTHSLGQLLDRLDERERTILTRHFGIGPDGVHQPPQTLATIAGELGIGAERARQLEHRALRKLRQIALELDLPVPDFGSGPLHEA